MQAGAFEHILFADLGVPHHTFFPCRVDLPQAAEHVEEGIARVVASRFHSAPHVHADLPLLVALTTEGCGVPFSSQLFDTSRARITEMMKTEAVRWDSRSMSAFDT